MVFFDEDTMMLDVDADALTDEMQNHAKKAINDDRKCLGIHRKNNK
jgi:hypothetical protein